MTAWADQIAAARRETARMTGALLDLGALKPASSNRGVQRWLDRWKEKGQPVAGCHHAEAPTMLLGVLTKPGTVYCVQCAVDVVNDQVQANLHCCDACGRKAKRFHEVVIPLAEVLLLWGHVCQGCPENGRG